MFLNWNPLALFPSYTFLLFIVVAVCLVLGCTIAALAARKGYSFAAWLGVGALILPAALVLGFLPNARDMSLSAAERHKLRSRKRRRNGAIAVNYLARFLMILMQLVSFPGSSDADRSRFFEQLYSPANQFVTWIELLTFLVVLSAYAMRPRGTRSRFIVGALLLLAFVASYFAVVSLVERRLFGGELPFQVVYPMHYLVRVLHYFGLTALCLGVLAARPTTDASGA